MRLLLYSLLSLFLCACNNDVLLFTPLPAETTGINFNNAIEENDQLNMINYQYLYNGGGVGIGDFNNDSLPDIYFTGTVTGNKLYLNKGNFKFEDATAAAGVEGQSKWCRGISVVDINNDGLLDIYVCAAAWQTAELRKNIFYINQGVDPVTKIPKFKDLAEAYGLDDTTSTHMATFFDYDNDGDLDVYLLVNDLNKDYPNTFRPIKTYGSALTTDRLYRNDWNPVYNRPKFTNISKEAGIVWEGYGLGINVVDINRDGWKDIYISNDYLSGNLLYVSNKNGTFTNRYQEYFKQSSLNAMGNDVGDINNDGLLDVVEMDMMPEDNYRSKKMMPVTDYNWYQLSEQFNFPYQAVRNTLQLNQGPRVLQNDSMSAPVFSEVGRHAGIAFTDWSWSALLMDADMDGYKDLMTTNGLPKDVTDLDFIAYREGNASATVQQLVQKLPPVFTSNYIFKNKGDVSFKDVTSEWGWNFPTYSAGMAYADFDMDGDMDVVVNNTNMPATVLKNNSEQQPKKNNYLKIKLRGDTANINGLGTYVQLFYGQKQQVAEFSPYRGYMSSVEPVLHFGLGAATQLDSLKIIWPNGKTETMRQVNCNQTLLLSQSVSATAFNYTLPVVTTNSWFTNKTLAAGITYEHSEQDFVDFNTHRQLPKKLSAAGPATASGDLNGDGLTDIIIGGSNPKPATVLWQQPGGRFVEKPFYATTTTIADDVSICLMDADNDNDLDVLLFKGGYQWVFNTAAYKDELYINQGNQLFVKDSMTLPTMLFNKSCVKAADYDGDGDMDLFVGTRTGETYPQGGGGYLLRNDSRSGKISFTDITKTAAPVLQQAGMITDALWTDADNDNDADLIITQDWGGILCYKNNNGQMVLQVSAMEKETGWWNSITAADIDNDGDMDYICGNLGTNAQYSASTNAPMHLYAANFNGASTKQFLVSWYRPASMHGASKEFPVAMRDQLAEELPGIKKQFPDHTSYANADMTTVLAALPRTNEVVLSATNFNTGWWQNNGNFNFAWHALPVAAQLAPVYGVCAADFNADGFIDLLLNGNEFSMHPMHGRIDAMNGLLLQGDGTGGFKPLSIANSGVFIPGNGKAVVSFPYLNTIAIWATQNSGIGKLFINRVPVKTVAVSGADHALVQLKNGQQRKEEFYSNSSYQSQQMPFVQLNSSIKKITLFKAKQVTGVIE
jgi:enediyne biosynthesis protein E4